MGADISKWDTSSVISMFEMFGETKKFNQDLSSWNVSAVTNMANMFWNVKQFNQDLSSWNVGAVNRMDSMFWVAENFDQSLCWDISDKDTWRMFDDSKGGCILPRCCRKCDPSLLCSS